MEAVVNIVAMVSATPHERFELVNDPQLNVIDSLLFFGILPSAIHRLRESIPTNIHDGADKRARRYNRDPIYARCHFCWRCHAYPCLK
jgi:hypothetical protein